MLRRRRSFAPARGQEARPRPGDGRVRTKPLGSCRIRVYCLWVTERNSLSPPAAHPTPVRGRISLGRSTESHPSHAACFHQMTSPHDTETVVLLEPSPFWLEA